MTLKQCLPNGAGECRNAGLIEVLVRALEAARDYTDAEYYNGTPEDHRPRRGDYPALDETSDKIRNALAAAIAEAGA